MKKFLSAMLVCSMCLFAACSSTTEPEESMETEETTISAESESDEPDTTVGSPVTANENGQYTWDVSDMSAQEIYDLVIDIIHYDTADSVNGTVENFLEPTPFGLADASVWQGTAEIPLAAGDGDYIDMLSLMNITNDNGEVVITDNLEVYIRFSFTDRDKAEELYGLLGDYYFDHYTQYETPDTEYYMTRDLDDGGWFLERPGGGGIYALSLFEENGKYNLSISLSVGSMQLNGIEI